MKRISTVTGLFVLLLSLPGLVFAGGGPRNVLVLMNEASDESMELANEYIHVRGIPYVNVLRVNAPTSLTTDMAAYMSTIEDPIKAHIGDPLHPYRNWIDYIVLTRGLPIRYSTAGGQVSITAGLQVMDTALSGQDQTSLPGIGNPYRARDEYFSHSKTFGGDHYYIGATFNGYTKWDAFSLITQSVLSDGNPATGTFFLEEASGNADVRKLNQLQAAAATLVGLGYDAQAVARTDPEVTGADVAGHLSGGSYSSISESDIYSNNFLPGAIIDLLESYGCVPANFDPGQSPSQTPGTWYVGAGATGVHCTVAEPYAHTFPPATLFEPYVNGYNLAETYYQGIPYLYWMNIVLGDPIAQPYANVPDVTFITPSPSELVSGTILIEAQAVLPLGGDINKMEFFVDDMWLGPVFSNPGQISLNTNIIPDGFHRIDAVAFEESNRFTQGTGSVWIDVDNHGLWITITDPTSVGYVHDVSPVTVDFEPSVVTFDLLIDGQVAATGSGAPPLSVDVDFADQPWGWHEIQAIGEDGSGTQAISAPVIQNGTPFH
ncbi:TIGR03790 family protein [Acidobacteriota bacterium]